MEQNNVKIVIFSNFVIDLFKSKYQHLFNNDNNDIIDTFEKECKDKANELNMDVENLSLDGELFGFDDDDHYKNSKKYFWWDYYGKQICTYNWV